MAYEADGGINPNNPDALTDAPKKPDQAPRFGDLDRPRKGQLLELEEPRAAKLAADIFFDKTELYSQQLAQWTVNELRRKGVAGVSLKRTASDRWETNLEPDATADGILGPNKLAQICRRLVGVIFADPPRPDPVPGSGEEEDVESTELAGRILEDLDAESMLNELAAYRKGFDRASNTGSSFIHYTVNPRGGGYKPITVEAHPDAQGFDDALEYPQQQPVLVPTGMVGPDGQPEMAPDPSGAMEPVLDPETGEPVMAPWPEEELVERYVTWGGLLSDDPGSPETAYRWVPRLERVVLSGRNVRPIPHDAEDIWDARGVQIIEAMTWGKIKDKWPKFASWDEDDEGRVRRDAIFSYRPDDYDKLFPPHLRRRLRAEVQDVNEKVALVLTTYMLMGDEYGEGAWLITLGESEVAHRDSWCWEKETGEKERLDLPLTQIAQLDEGEETFYKHGVVSVLSSANEARMAIFDAAIRHLEKMDNQLIFAPIGSNFQSAMQRLPFGTLVKILPGGQPYWQPIDEFPQFGYQFFELFGRELNSDSGLEQAAQGLEDPSVQSGKHAQTIISQVYAGLSELIQNVERALVRGWRIKLQLVAAFYDVPQKLQWAGDDKEYQLTSWLGSDLASVRDVQIQKGTFTQLSRQAKAMLAQQLFTMGVIDHSRYQKMVRQNLGATIGMQDDEHFVRIHRQLAGFKKGPPRQYEEQEPVQEPVLDAASGQTVMQWPVLPELARIFEPTPADTLPDIAQIRLREIADFMGTKKYIQFPPWWRAGLDQEFLRMQVAVGLVGQPMREPPEGGGGPPAAGEEEGPSPEEGAPEANQPPPGEVAA